MKRSLLFLAIIFSCFFSAIAQSPTAARQDSLKKLLANSKQDTNYIKALIELEKLIKYQEPFQALKYSKEAFGLSKKMSFKWGEFASLMEQGLAFKDFGNTDSALYLFNEALRIATLLKDYKKLCAVNNNIGITYFDKEEYDKALAYYFKALSYADGKNDLYYQASTNNNIANLFFIQKQLDKALDYHQKSLGYSLKLGDKFKIASSYNNLGLIYRDKGDIKNALISFNNSLRLAKEMNNKMGIALLSNNIGNMLYRSGSAKEALEYLFESKRIREEIGDKRGLANVYSNIADVYDLQGDLKKGIEMNEKAIALCKELGLIGVLSNCYKDLAETYSSMKDYKKAYEYHQLYSTTKDSLFSSEKSEQINEIAAKYETEKKENEIKLLSKDKRIQAAEIKQQKSFRNFLIGISVLILSLLVMMTIFFRNKQRANKQLALQKLEIEHKNEELNQQNEEILAQRDEIERQKDMVDEKNKEITDSILYASRIQNALLTSESYIEKYISDFFIFYQPKDIVSGDFYWAAYQNKKLFFAIADCTGHGVPGAFMSMMGIGFLNELVLEKKLDQPNEILNELRDKIIKALNPEGKKEQARDGMDIVLVAIDFSNNKLEYASANNSLYLIREGLLQEYKGNKFPVGIHEGEKMSFTLNTINLQSGDLIFICTDGYADQFGGEKGKKFKYRQMEELFIKNAMRSMELQKEQVASTINNWKGKYEQVDDMLVVGIKI